VAQQQRRGDAHVYGARSRFMSRGVLAQLEPITWPVGDATSRALSPDAPRVDIAGKLRGLWA